MNSSEGTQSPESLHTEDSRQQLYDEREQASGNVSLTFQDNMYRARLLTMTGINFNRTLHHLGSLRRDLQQLRVLASAVVHSARHLCGRLPASCYIDRKVILRR